MLALEELTADTYINNAIQGPRLGLSGRYSMTIYLSYHDSTHAIYDIHQTIT